jgi:hypothetical protein
MNEQNVKKISSQFVRKYPSNGDVTYSNLIPGKDR